jgi:hypothetical protein
MVLAHLRGLLLPDYKQGLRSVARENMVLAAIDYEMTADTMRDQSMLQASFSSFISPTKATESLRQMMGTLRRLSELSMLNTKWQAIPEAEASLFKLFEALEKAGIIKDNIDDGI